MSGLDVAQLSVHRGAIEVCHDVSLSAPDGQITVLLGANGSGKSTLLDGIAGIAPVTGGSVRIGERDLTGAALHRRVGAGLGYVQSGRPVFASLSVDANLRVAGRVGDSIERAYSLFPNLARRRGVRAGLLSGGEQQMLVIARALAVGSRVLMVDEPSVGLAPSAVAAIMSVLERLADEGLAVLLVEQFAGVALAVGTTAYVMQRGRLVSGGPCGNLVGVRDFLGLGNQG